LFFNARFAVFLAHKDNFVRSAVCHARRMPVNYASAQSHSVEYFSGAPLRQWNHDSPGDRGPKRRSFMQNELPKLSRLMYVDNNSNELVYLVRPRRCF